MRNIVLELSYNGANYSGWQVQVNKETIQGVVTKTLNKILDENIKLIGSGRTDSGVSAIKQVANFLTNNKMNCFSIKGRLNSLLPRDIKIINCYEVSQHFNSQFDAKRKTYAYSFYIGKNVIPYYDGFATYFGSDLDINIFEREMKFLVGVFDFTSFCASNTSVKDKVREIYSVDLEKHNNSLYTFIVTGSGFLYNMVRIMVGTIADISRGKLNDSVSDVINKKDRVKAGVTAPSKGLILLDVEY